MQDLADGAVKALAAIAASAHRILSAAVFSKTLLESGVRVITEAIPTVRSVAAGVWVHTGSRDEAPVQAGISHFIEHMVFKGTRRRRMQHIARRLESVGGYLNAFTSKEYTCFEARALDVNLARAIDTAADLVVDPLFPEKELQKEKCVVLEEMKMYADTPEDMIFERFERIVYANHAFGHPIIGLPDTVSALSQADLFGYLNRRYTPERIVLAAAGNLSHQAVVRAAERAFMGLRKRTSNGPEPRESLGRYMPQRVEETRPIQQAHMVLGRRGLDIGDSHRAAMNVASTILGGGMSSRLNQNIREKHGFCYNVFAFLNMHSDTGDFGVYAGTDTAHVDRVEKLVFRECAKLAGRQVSARTLSQAKNQIKGSILLGLESMNNRMTRIARQELFFGRYITLDEVLEELHNVSADDVQAVAQELFVPAEFSRMVVLPES